MQLRFASFAVINLRRDFHPQERAHAGRTQKKLLPDESPAGVGQSDLPLGGKVFRQAASMIALSVALGRIAAAHLTGSGR